ncbi:MAG TPA: FAD-dependent oxidoreductase [Thermoanaerobaculia bacterium]|nr:FAD-dependent oxidoreductase [Thermoanaerobaculia bacterium]
MPRTELFTQLRRALRVADRLERQHVRTELALEQAAEDWSRRRFLKTSAVAAAGATLAFPRIARADDLRVVILGAGTAGLTCAYRLQHSGIHASVLEASPRVGGRMYSLSNYFPDDQVAELGGELIDTDHHAIRNLARELDIDLIDLAYLDHSTGHDYYIDGKLYKSDAEWIEAFRPVAEAVRRDLGENNENCDVTWNSGTARGKELDAMSVAEWLDRNRISGQIRKVIEAAYVGEFGLQLEEQSALNLLCAVGTTPDTFGIFGESNERFRCRGGNGSIPIRLAQELTRSVEVGTVVESIRNRNGGFELGVRRGRAASTIKADIVVTTIPLTVMRKLDLRNLDLTPAQRDTIMNQGYGTNSKMMVGLSARPWVQMNVTAYTFTDLPFQACWDTSRGQRGQNAILTNFTGGRQGLRVGEGALQDRAREFVAQADKVFPGANDAYTGKAVRQVWPTYEFSQGSYTCFRPGQYQRYFRALVEPQGRLFFAGEHTVDESGFMNAAVESGERAATQVLSAMGLAQMRRDAA